MVISYILLFFLLHIYMVFKLLLTCVLSMTLNCIRIFIFTGSFLYWCVMRLASQRFFIIHSCIYLWILIISYLAAFLGTNSLYVLMCCKAVNQSINTTYFHFQYNNDIIISKVSHCEMSWERHYHWKILLCLYNVACYDMICFTGQLLVV